MELQETDNATTSKEEEFKVIFMEYHSRLYYYALSYVMDEEMAKDIVCDVFEALWREYDHIKKEPLCSYLHACTRNRCVDFLRHQSIQQQYADFLIENARYECVSSVQEADERLSRIRKAIDVMPSQRRRVLCECFFNEKPYKKVAADLGITIDGVKRHVTLALKSLRDLFSTR